MADKTPGQVAKKRYYEYFSEFRGDQIHGPADAYNPDAAWEAAAVAVREAVHAPYRWRSISEIHEDYGTCVLMHLGYPGQLALGSNLDGDFRESDWTHFAEVPKLTSKEANELRRQLSVSGTAAQVPDGSGDQKPAEGD